MSPIEFLFLFLLIAISGFLSSSEVAFFSLSRFQLRSLKENFRPSHKKIKHLLSDPGGLLVSLLVANELVNIALSTLIASTISRNNISIRGLPDWAADMLLGILVTTPILLFLCEITPKVIGAQINLLIAPLAARPITFLYRALSPIRAILKYVLRIFSASKPADSNHGILKESEFLLMVEEGHREGAIRHGEFELIRSVFRLDNTTVAEITTPISQVLSFSTQTTLKGALAAIRSQRYSRIPVLSTQKREVLGVIYAKDLIRAMLQDTSAHATPVTGLMRKPYFVSPEIRLNTLFRRFKQHRVHIAIVKNSNGEVLGIVTMNDILDYLFEDFFSEDEDTETIERLTHVKARKSGTKGDDV